MPKLILYTLFMLLFLPSAALAKVEVNISNNLEGSNNSVKINSDTGGNSYKSTNSTNNETNIIIESNGEKKEYHGSGTGNIELKSSDGKNSVTVNNNGVSNKPNQTLNSTVNTTTNIQVNSNADASSPSPSGSPEATVAGVFTDNSDKEDEKMGLWEYVKKELEELFSLFS